jgi:hypothetical protein
MVFYGEENYFACVFVFVICWFTLVKGKNKASKLANSLPRNHYVDNIDRINERWIH